MMKNEGLRQQYEQMPQPHDTDTENAVLATLIRHNEKFQQYNDLLSPELFYYEKEKALYKCIDGVITSGGIADVNSLVNYAKTHDVGYVVERYDLVEIFNAANPYTLEQDIVRLRDMGKRRQMWRMLQQASTRVLDVATDLDEEVNGIMASVGEVQSDLGTGDVASFGDALDEVGVIVKGNSEGVRQSLRTGFKLFDDYYLLRPSTMTVIAAFTGVGKSALALNITMAVGRQGIPSAYYSLEMGKSELASRGISKDMELSASVIMNRALSPNQIDTFHKAVEKNRNLPIYFDDRSTVTFDRTMRSIRTMVKTKGIKLAVIDYLQIYNQMRDDEEQGVAYMARALKNMAKETGIAIIVISQLNRSGDHPSIKMLRGSGQIEESADNIVLIDRPEAYPDNKVTKYAGEYSDCSIHNTAKLILSKGRGVGTGSALVAFDGKSTRFYEIEKPTGGKYSDSNEALPF